MDCGYGGTPQIPLGFQWYATFFLFSFLKRTRGVSKKTCARKKKRAKSGRKDKTEGKKEVKSANSLGGSHVSTGRLREKN